MKKILALAMTLCFIFASVAGSVPQRISFQGVLKDSNENPVEGEVSVLFTIYSSGGTDLWHETQTVTVEGGIYDVQLGANTDIPFSVFADGSTKYLGIKVGSDAEMTPRLPMIAVPYAFRAATAEAAESLSGYPVGVTGNNIVPRTDGSGKLNSGVIPFSGASVSYASSAGNADTADYATLAGSATTAASATNAGQVDGLDANSTAAAGELLALDSNLQFKGMSISAEAAGSIGIGVYGKSTQANGFGMQAENTATGGNAIYINGGIKAPGCAGTGTVISGSYGQVNNDYVNANSLIFITVATSSAIAADEPLRVYNVGSGSFRVTTYDGNPGSNIHFNYLVINQ